MKIHKYAGARIVGTILAYDTDILEVTTWVISCSAII